MSKYLKICLNNMERGSKSQLHACPSHTRYVNARARVSTKLAQSMPKGKATNRYKQETDITKSGINEANGGYPAHLLPSPGVDILDQNF